MYQPNLPGVFVFANYRLATYAIVFSFSGVVLGLAANFANLFLPNIHHDFTIFSLVVPALTIFMFLVLVNWSTAYIEVPVLFILAALWLAMGSWSADVIGHIECYPLGGETTPTKHGTMSARTYCYEMKVIEAFSWMNFVILVFIFLFTITLANRAFTLGRRFAWSEDIRLLPWFNEYSGYQAYPMQGGYYQPGGVQYGANGGYVVQQAPGHSVVIQQGPNGQPQVQQVPGMVQSM